MNAADKKFPIVSVIVPCFNEQATIELLLEGILLQIYPQDRIEVVIADGMSTDATRARIDHFAGAHPQLDIRVVENPQRVIPAGVNRAIAAARGEIIIRMDAHSKPYPDYIARCVENIETGMGDNVGGVWEIRPGSPTWVAASIAIAAAHPLGVGDAHYRFTERPQYVDTVPFGAFSRQFLTRLAMPSHGAGPYDETLLSNEDYEFNVRVRQAGGKVYLDPAIRTVYYARSSLKDLARQYWRYGYWKYRMLRRYPETVKWRQALPPVFALGIIGLSILALFNHWFGLILLVALGFYLSILMFTSLGLAYRSRKIFPIWGVPLAIFTMHFVWGLAFLWSLVKYAFKGATPA